MCFSATASFAASSVLLGASAVTLSSMKRQPTMIFALIPLLFAVQQAIEGFQWLALADGSPSLPLGYAFLFFAYLFWPLFLPLAALQAESDPTRRLLIKICLSFGVLAVAILGHALVTGPLVVEQVGQSINYSVKTSSVFVLPIAYVIAVVGGGLLVRRFWIQMFALLGLIGLAISYLAYTQTYQSVWCFFAAVLSLCVIMELRSSSIRSKKK